MLCAQAVEPYTLADLQERLVPTGIWSRYRENEYYSHRTAIAISTVQYNTALVELLPLPLLQHGCERTPMRVRRVTIVSAPGSLELLHFCVWACHEAHLT